MVDNHLAERRRLSLVSLNTFYKPYEVAAEQILEVWKFNSLLTDKLPEADDPMQELNRSVQQIKGGIEELLSRR